VRRGAHPGLGAGQTAASPGFGPPGVRISLKFLQDSPACRCHAHRDRVTVRDEGIGRNVDRGIV